MRFFSRPTSFNPRAPHGARLYEYLMMAVVTPFQSTRPARGATASQTTLIVARIGFNPRAPHGARQVAMQKALPDLGFNPRAPHGARHPSRQDGHHGQRVSIHAPRTGRDARLWTSPAISGGFNPRAPHGARHPVISNVRFTLKFQSTRPARGATCFCRTRFCRFRVSIHAPRTGRDILMTMSVVWLAMFQSTRPARGATAKTDWTTESKTLFQSTRPARGATTNWVARVETDKRFNPRAPHGARLRLGRQGYARLTFQSTRPARGATVL